MDFKKTIVLCASLISCVSNGAEVESKPTGLAKALVPAVQAPIRSNSFDEEERVAAQLKKLDDQKLLIDKEIALESARSQLSRLKGNGRGISGTPTLIGISGNKTALTGKFIYDSGDVVYARINDNLPNNVQLVNLTSSRALIKKADGEEMVLPLVFARALQPTLSGFQSGNSGTIPVDSAGPITGRTVGR